MPDLTATELMHVLADLSPEQKAAFVTHFDTVKINRTKAFGLAVYLGVFGADRFFLGDTSMGLLKLFTAGGCGIWHLVDLFTVTGRTDALNRQAMLQTLAAIRVTSATSAPVSALVGAAEPVVPVVESPEIVGKPVDPPTCPSCGAPVSTPPAGFCERCGTALSRA